MKKVLSFLLSIILIIALFPAGIFSITASAESNISSFVYEDVDSGVSFGVPDNWKQEEFTKDREYIDVKFVSTKEDGYTIIYGSVDMWNQMPDSYKVGYTRSDINNSFFTKSDISEMFNTTDDKITTVSYNGVQYFKGETQYTKSVYSVDITVTMTQLLYINNGWMHMFQFSGSNTHKLYPEFENLLLSVHYPSNYNLGGSGSSNNTNLGNYNDDESSAVAVFIVLLIIVPIIIVVVVLLYKKKGATETTTNNIPDTALEFPSNTEILLYCRHCGQELPLDSEFCHKCGTKILKEDTTQ